MEIELDKAKLYFEVQGNPDNPPLVLWHGAGCTLRMWDLVVEQLKNLYFTIAFDIRGAGNSINNDLNEDAYTFQQYSEDLNSILNFLDINQVHLWSMAWGTRAAIAYSSLNPNKVLSAVFSDASIEIADIDAQRLGSREALSKQDESGIERFNLPQGWNIHADKDSAAKSLSAAAKFDLQTAFSHIDFPFMIMTGDHDPNLSSSKNMVSNLKGGELRILENVGHGSILQRPDLTVESFLEWHNKILGA
tara:strand:- start:548 stop:1291 length:744 start_codon:yes stop_codon:yes gene_type:complete